jgi:hypothetical protein
MSENVRRLKEAFARFEREGTPHFEMFDPEIELINFDSFPITQRYHGWDGILDWLVEVSEPFDEFRLELVDVHAHDEHVVTTCRVSGVSRAGGPPFELVWGSSGRSGTARS